MTASKPTCGQRVGITGLGVVAPNGIGREEFWRNSLAGGSWIRPIRRFETSRFRCRVAGEVGDFQADDFVDRKVRNQTDRSVHMALAASQLAAEDAGLDLSREDPDEVGMAFSNLFGGMEFAEPELYGQTYLGPAKVSAYQAIAWFYAAAQGQWSIGNGIRGWGKTFVADRAGGLHALAWATLAIRCGHCSVAFAGGFEAPLAPFVYAIHQASGLLATADDGRRSPYRPLDESAAGLVLAEGAAVLVIEDLARARARGARVYAELAGYCLNQDSQAPGGPVDGRVDCLRGALAAADVDPGTVGHVLAEGCAVPVEDRAELLALDEVFGGGPEPPGVSCPKAMTGHALAAAGGLDAAWACLMLHHQIALPTPNLEQPASPRQRFIFPRAPQRRPLQAVVCCGRARGGGNAVVVLTRAA